MDMNINQATNGTTTNTSSGSSRPPSWVWVLVALASAITIGIILFAAYQFVKRRRARRQQGDAERGDAVSRGGGSTRGSLPLWPRRRRPRSRSQPASRWGWVYPGHTNRTSTQSSEGLNELGEAPPPYNEDDLEPCLNVDMAEVHALGLGEGPSRVASRQDRESLVGGGVGSEQPGHPEPPAYDFAVSLASTVSLQQPPPAIVVSEPRVS